MSSRTLTATRPSSSAAFNQNDDIDLEKLLDSLQMSVNTPSPCYYNDVPAPTGFESRYFSNRRQTPPTGDLLGDFELIGSNESTQGGSTPSPPILLDYPSGTSSEGVLVDVDDDHKKSSPTKEVLITLLQKTVCGLKLDWEDERWVPHPVKIDPGHVMMTLESERTQWVKAELEDWQFGAKRTKGATSKPILFIGDVRDPTLCAAVSPADVMLVSESLARILLSVPRSERLELYSDFERVSFLEALSVGSEVLVNADPSIPMLPAEISWMGRRDNHDGIWYNVNFIDNENDRRNHSTFPQYNNEYGPPGLSSWTMPNGGSFGSTAAAHPPRLFYGPHQIHKPSSLKGGGVAMYDNRVPVSMENSRERVIPIKRRDIDEIETSYYSSKEPPKPMPRPRRAEERSRATSSSSSASNPPPAPRLISSAGVSNEGPSPYPQGTLKNMNESRPPEYRAMTASKSHQKLSPASSSSAESSRTPPPSRSKSAQSIASKRVLSLKNEHVSDERTNGARVGDSCIWVNDGKAEKGVIRFLGLLTNHSGIYAGIEFERPIGAGTGTFSGEQLFYARDSHAGFVELGALEILDRPPRRLSSSRAHLGGPPAASGSSVSVPVRNKQASSESLSDPPPAYTPPSPPRSSSAASHHHIRNGSGPPPVPSKPPMHVEDFLIDSFDVGSNVTVCHLGAQRTGVVHWLGDAMSEDGDRIERSAVVELDDDVPPAWRPSIDAPNSSAAVVLRGTLVPATALRRTRHNYPPYAHDPAPRSTSATFHKRAEEFGSIDSGVEKSRCPPPKDVLALIGRQRGIQGHCNSCYLDATLYAMFAQTTFFDFLLERKPKKDDHKLLEQFQKVLAHEIVYPLRKFHYVRADHTMKLREILAEMLPTMNGLTSEEKDPEEILAQLFANIFRVDPFIKLVGSGNSHDSQYLCPVVVEDWQGGAATTQHLLERHMRAAQLQFARPPGVLILQLPRYGQQKVFDKILPLEKIDITPLVAGAVPPCSGCSTTAQFFCPTCFLTRRVFFTEISYCQECFRRSHASPDMHDHAARELFPPMKPVKKPSSHKMILSAVLCIETSHYVAFVRSHSGRWIFFDSMADREGLSDGFNVPVVKECENMSSWLSSSGWDRLNEADETGQVKAMFGKGAIDPLVSRLLSDSYICFYEDVNQTTSSASASSSGASTSSSAASLLTSVLKRRKD
ncbi:unnamed protein product [Caenorhabditis auriculariae]|uniref:ubiquitinyl hydrolase 1 n=1 Tax=Caenorhabditis auriculariae TaxID=2777116 RepID=A0A8S1GSX2_9PELO|nr:unnamed protein product [Caenorhabditis auriculariae]